MKQLSKAVCVALLFANGCDGTSLGRTCPRWCYTGRADTRDVGLCRRGQPTCDEFGRVTACEDQVTPHRETCNGLDDDCNGAVDDYFKPTLLCTGPGVCAAATPWCEGGAESCARPSTYEEPEESCDGLDNDCDGWVDEELFPGELCYSGPLGTEITGTCRPGAWRCVAGEKVCEAEVLPASELCNHLDDDCDGVVDEGLSTVVDLIVGLDTSGSMSQDLTVVTGVLAAYLLQAAPDLRVTVLDVAHPTAPEVLIDARNPYWAAHDLGDVIANGDSIELAPAGIALACSVDGLAFRPGARRAYLGFTDEAAQPYGITVAELATACAATATQVFQWAPDTAWYQPACDATGGACRFFPTTAPQLAQQITDSLAGLCVEAP